MRLLAICSALAGAALAWDLQEISLTDADPLNWLMRVGTV
jgi:hypothetical protein